MKGDFFEKGSLMEKCRYIALTDVNSSRFPWVEKDDIQSLIRLFLYSNEIDIEGIVLCSSCFLKHGGGKGAKKIVDRILNAYGQVKRNLDCHADGYPPVGELRERVFCGIPAFGKAFNNGFGEEKYKNNPGVQCIVKALESQDSRPLWIGLWGGANTLAQALWQLSETKGREEMKEILKKLRIYSISDQDYSSKWIRANFGEDLFYIVTPSDGGFEGRKEYYRAVWPGISADENGHGSEDGIHGGGFQGANSSLVLNDWIRENIQSKGPLGKLYPKTVYIMEGDTPAFLGLIQNGLNVPEHPELGGWHGRYQKSRDEQNVPIWSGAYDSVLGIDGKVHQSPQASLWRWREDFQYDFASRMEWTVADSFDKGSHPPVVILNGPSVYKIKKGESVSLDASSSYSPDGFSLSFHWFFYPESENAVLVKNGRSCVSVSFLSCGIYHLVLKLTGSRSFPLSRYLRITFEVEEE